MRATLPDFATWFRTTPEGRQLEVSYEQQLLAERMVQARIKTQARATLDANLSALDAAVEKAATALHHATEGMKAAQGRHGEAQATRYRAIAAHDAAVTQADAALRDTADPGIAQTVRDIFAAIDDARLTTSKGTHALTTVECSRLRALADTAEALLLVADSDVMSQLAAIRTDAGLSPLLARTA